MELGRGEREKMEPIGRLKTSKNPPTRGQQWAGPPKTEICASHTQGGVRKTGQPQKDRGQPGGLDNKTGGKKRQ